MQSETRIADAPTSENFPASAARTGEVLAERYELIAKIGEGGMGEVYEARHTTLGRHFAIKLLHPELARSQRMLRRFSREALAASRLRSDHIVSVFDCGHTSDGVPYFVMELLRGKSLRRILRNEQQLSVPRTLRLLIDACRGLHIAHAEGLVHRDLKPENLFVVESDSGQESAKILDFGVVLTSADTLATQPGALIGTIKYMAPEQVRGASRVDARVDVYALGVVLYECLTGEVPHPGENPEEVLFHIVNEQPKSASTLRPDLPPQLRAVIDRAMAREATARYQSASELADALLPFAGETLPPVRNRRLLLPPESTLRDTDQTEPEQITAETATSTPSLPRKDPVRLRGYVLAFALGAVLATVLLSFLVLKANRTELKPLVVEIPVKERPPPAVAQLASEVATSTAQPSATTAVSARATEQSQKRELKVVLVPSATASARTANPSPAPSSKAPASPFDTANPYDP